MAEPDPPSSPMSHEDPVADAPGAQPDSRLDEAELERLNGVLMNSVYPQFQYDFKLDHEGRAAINAFIASMPEGLAGEDLDAISAMIERELSGPAAGDVAFLITHLYRLEQEEARMMSEGAPVTTMAGQLEAQERLAQLRDEWFGPELSARLFSDTDDAETSSAESAAESPAEDSSTEELPQIQAEEQAELADIESAWEQRYQRFLAEKQFIDDAGLDQTEKDRQIETLLQQHYTPQELEAARAYDQLRE